MSMTSTLTLPALRMPGATLVTRLKVYDTPSIDAQRGGTPHVHLLCSELYFVTLGSGAVEMIDWNGFSKVDLEPHAALLFSPGTLHRLINPESNLELFIVMQNSGLPERGDNVVSFKNELLANNEVYAETMKVSSFEEAYARRDKGVEGFLELKAAFEKDLEMGRKALSQFYERAAERTRTLRETWHSVVTNGPLHEAQQSLAHLGNLEQGKLDYLQHAQRHHIDSGAYKTPGFCGALERYFDPATLELEGHKQE